MNRAMIALSLASLLTTVSGSALADDAHATAVCKAHFPAVDDLSFSDIGVQNHSTSAAVNVYCPLKTVTCGEEDCVLNATASAVDNNSVNGTDANVTCSLHVAMKASPGTTYNGTPQTVGSAGPVTSLSLSVTIENPGTGMLYAKCSIGKGGSSYVNWFAF